MTSPSSEHILYRVELNAMPWTPGNYVGGRMVKDGQLVAYQAAIREELDGLDPRDIEPPYQLTFYVWRQLELKFDPNKRRRSRAHQSDATNIQKATEDALQGILIGNDRDVLDIRTVLVAQGPEVDPCVIIQIERADPWSTVPFRVLDLYQEGRKPLGDIHPLDRSKADF